MFNLNKGEKNMNTRNEIKEVENKIKTARSFIDANFNVAKDPDGKNMSDKVVNAFETEIYSQLKLKQLKLKLEYEKNLSNEILKINKSLNMKVVSRETNYDCTERGFIDGFYPEKIEIMYEDKVVPLTFMYDGFYISYKDHGGQALFNLFEDKVEDKHLFYTKERA